MIDTLKDKHSDFFEKIQSILLAAALLNYTYEEKNNDRFVFYVLNYKLKQINFYIHFWDLKLFAVEIELTDLDNNSQQVFLFNLEKSGEMEKSLKKLISLL